MLVEEESCSMICADSSQIIMSTANEWTHCPFSTEDFLKIGTPQPLSPMTNQ